MTLGETNTGLEELICSLCSQGQALKRQRGHSYGHPSLWQGIVKKDSSVLTLLTFNLNSWGSGLPSSYSPSWQFWELSDSFYCGILWHRKCMITWTSDTLTCDALPNPLAESGRSLQKFVSTSCLVVLGNFFFVMQQLSCCYCSTLLLHSS